MNRRSCLGFTLSSFAVMTPATALADEPAEAEAAPAPPAAPDAPPDPDAPPAPPKARVFVAAEGSYTYQSLYGISMTGVGVSAVIAREHNGLSVGADFDFVRGWTEDGLQTTTLGLGPVLEGQIDQLRVGGGVRIGTFDVSRVTSTSSLLSASAGLFLRASYDLMDLGRPGHSTLYVVGRASVDSVDAPLYAASIGLGLRL